MVLINWETGIHHRSMIWRKEWPFSRLSIFAISVHIIFHQDLFKSSHFYTYPSLQGTLLHLIGIWTIHWFFVSQTKLSSPPVVATDSFSSLPHQISHLADYVWYGELTNILESTGNRHNLLTTFILEWRPIVWSNMLFSILSTRFGFTWYSSFLYSVFQHTPPNRLTDFVTSSSAWPSRKLRHSRTARLPTNACTNFPIKFATYI